MQSSSIESEKKFSSPTSEKWAEGATLKTGASRALWLISGLALGAGAMFFLDPANGPARRSSLRQRTNSLGQGAYGSLRSVASGVRSITNKVVEPVRGMMSSSSRQAGTAISAENIRSSAGASAAKASSRSDYLQ